MEDIDHRLVIASVKALDDGEQMNSWHAGIEACKAASQYGLRRMSFSDRWRSQTNSSDNYTFMLKEVSYDDVQHAFNFLFPSGTIGNIEVQDAEKMIRDHLDLNTGVGSFHPRG